MPTAPAAPSAPKLPRPGLLRARWQAWWMARQPASDTHELTQRNLYIVPSRAGLAFGLTLVVLLIATINEQISLGYALTFLLAGAVLASMHTTHSNLRGLRMDLRPPDAVHAGDEVTLHIHLHNASGAARYGIGFQADGNAAPTWVNVPEKGHAELTLRLPMPTRGLHALPRLVITTRFPLGVFRAWSYWRPAAKVWVYPQAEAPTPPFPPQPEAGEGQAEASSARRRGTDFAGVRSYRAGDSPRHVLWRKSVALMDQGQAPWVRETEAPLAQELWFDLAQTAGGDLEAKLSRLTAWVLAAERAQQPYGLQMGASRIEPSLGAAHQRACLERLAGWQG